MRCFDVRFLLFVLMTAAMKSVAAQAAIPLVNIKSVDPTILIELRYAGRNNLAGHPLYPLGTAAVVRPEVAIRLAAAQAFLRRYQFQLKIWDAYRPAAVQTKLWQASHNNDYVANPEIGVSSLHSWGVAVDATLVDSHGNRDVRMPSAFDESTPAPMCPYMCSSFVI